MEMKAVISLSITLIAAVPVPGRDPGDAGGGCLSTRSSLLQA